MFPEFATLLAFFITKPGAEVVYVAGPMRGYPQFNFPAFDAASVRLLDAGYNVISPADIDRMDAAHSNDLTVEQVSTPAMCEKYALRDIAAIFKSNKVAVLRGWEKSTGATAEVALARWLRKPVICAETLKPIEAAPVESPLQEAERIQYGDRGQDYGHPLDECERIAGMWSIILGAKVQSHHIPLCMIAMKMSREMNRPKRDNYTDIAGYALCLFRIHDESKRRREAAAALLN